MLVPFNRSHYVRNHNGPIVETAVPPGQSVKSDVLQSGWHFIQARIELDRFLAGDRIDRIQARSLFLVQPALGEALSTNEPLIM